MSKKRLRIFTWHVHGSYLYYLSQGEYDIYIPLRNPVEPGYYGRGATFPFGNNVHEVPAEQVALLEFDCILFQSAPHFLHDQYALLSEEQRRLPMIYLEHDTPHQHPFAQPHFVQNSTVTVVHVTHYNALMWDNGNNRVKVIEHGVTDNGGLYTGEIKKGITILNHPVQRGRCVGWDVYQQMKKEVPLDIAGMATEDVGLGEVLHPHLLAFTAKYRFFFNPIRYTSLGLAVCEAMMNGLPVVGLATTEMVTVIENGVNGFIDTNIEKLAIYMKELLADKGLAYAMGANARKTARARFSIQRFCDEWKALFETVVEESAQVRHKELRNAIYSN